MFRTLALAASFMLDDEYKARFLTMGGTKRRGGSGHLGVVRAYGGSLGGGSGGGHSRFRVKTRSS